MSHTRQTLFTALLALFAAAAVAATGEAPAAPLPFAGADADDPVVAGFARMLGHEPCDAPTATTVARDEDPLLRAVVMPLGAQLGVHRWQLAAGAPARR